MTTIEYQYGRIIGPRMPVGLETVMVEGTRATPGAPAGRILGRDEVEALVKSRLSGRFAADPGIRYGDGSYYLPTRAEIEAIMRASQSDRRTWLQERFDCDDFAYVLKGEISAHAYDTEELRYGLCSGIVWGYFDWIGQPFHAVNWVLTSDTTLWLIEPQTDAIYPAERCTGGIALLLV